LLWEAKRSSPRQIRLENPRVRQYSKRLLRWKIFHSKCLLQYCYFLELHTFFASRHDPLERSADNVCFTNSRSAGSVPTPGHVSDPARHASQREGEGGGDLCSTTSHLLLGDGPDVTRRRYATAESRRGDVDRLSEQVLLSSVVTDLFVGTKPALPGKKKPTIPPLSAIS
jgi:hypothetical protein